MSPLPWRDPEPTPIPPALAEVVGEYFKLPPAELAGGPALVAATLAGRGVVDPQQARAFFDPRR